MACFCPDTPPESVKSRGTRGQRDAQILAKQDNPNVFALGLKDACCEEPCCCILSGLGAPFGCTACWARKAVLEKYSANGLDDYVCCQGYIPQCCCCHPGAWCAGSRLGLACEGLCCPVFSLSLARLHMMDAKQNRPDPCDYQIIQCSNCLQLISCVLDIVAIFVEQARDLAHIVDCLADLFTCSVAGCMGAQVRTHTHCICIARALHIGCSVGSRMGSKQDVPTHARCRCTMRSRRTRRRRA